MRPSLSFALAGLTILLLLATSGCAERAPAAWDVPTLPADVPRIEGEVVLPFDAYSLGLEELENLQVQEGALLSQCAADQGIEVGFGGDFIRPPDDTYLGWGGQMGTMKSSYAAKHGYHPVEGGSWAPVGGFYLRDPANIRLIDSSDSLAQKVIYGSGDPAEEGCYKRTESKIGGPLISTVWIESDLVNLSLKHPRVVEAQGAWRVCMSKSGFDYETVQSPSESFSMIPSSENERAVAISDVNCTKRSRWADFYYFVLAEYQKQAISRDVELFEKALHSQKMRAELILEQSN